MSSAIKHFPGNDLAEYCKAHPGVLIVQSRIKADLLIHYVDRSNKTHGAFVPRSLPVDLARQATVESMRRSDDLQRMVASKKILLVIPQKDNDQFMKALDAAESRILLSKGTAATDLYTVDELSRTNGGNGVDSDEQISVSVARDVAELNAFFAKQDSPYTNDTAVNKIIELNFSCESKADRDYVTQHITNKDLLKANWSE